jgi:REP element-mobilizing transposase RayT
MPARKHLRRLDQIMVETPIFFVTTCTANRRPVLACDSMHEICREVWRHAERLYGWRVGRYVLMPDHVHFFCAPFRDRHRLSTFVAKWKEWAAKHASRRHALTVPFWQDGFFDHVLRSEESYEVKWQYVLENPVRAGLVAKPEDWPYQGEIHKLRWD